MTNPGKYFHNNVANGLKLLEAARGCRREEIRLQLHLRHLRPARPRADDRGPAAAPDQSLRRIQADVREDAPVVSRDSRAGIRRLPLFQRRRRERQVRRASPHRNASHPQRAASRRWARSRSARSSAPITPRPTAPASAITSTSSTWPRRTSWPWQPGKQGFYNLGNGDGYSVREVIRHVREGDRPRPFPPSRSRAAPATRPGWSPPPTKAIRELGWKPKYPKLEDIVATAWAWHQPPQRLPGLSSRIMRNLRACATNADAPPLSPPLSPHHQYIKQTWPASGTASASAALVGASRRGRCRPTCAAPVRL